MAKVEQPIADQSGTFTKPEWNTERRRYRCAQNGLGQWWPKMYAKADSGGWCEIIIRDSNPFKTLKGAIKFVEQTIARVTDRDANK